MVRKILNQVINLILTVSLLIGCAAIPGKKIKLENYPELTGNKIQSLSLGYEFYKSKRPFNLFDTIDSKAPKSTRDFNSAIKNELDKIGVLNRQKGCKNVTRNNTYASDRIGSTLGGNGSILDVIYGVTIGPVRVTSDDKNYTSYECDSGSSVSESKKSEKESVIRSIDQTKCTIKLSSVNTKTLDGFCGPYYMTTFFTLFIVPYYCPQIYEAKATLISTSDNRVLKEYHLKDKVHEVWSSLWMLSWFVVKPNKYAPNAEYPKDAKSIMENKISKALSRQILNDASSFKECQKDQSSSSKNK